MSIDQASAEHKYPYTIYLAEQALGKLFMDVQMAIIICDSKTFVDYIPVNHPDTIISGTSSIAGPHFCGLQSTASPDMGIKNRQ